MLAFVSCSWKKSEHVLVVASFCRKYDFLDENGIVNKKTNPKERQMLREEN